MKLIRDLILSRVRFRVYTESSSSTLSWVLVGNQRKNVFEKMQNHMFGSVAGSDNDQIMDRVVGLVKKFDKIDSSKVTERADFQKDLCLDSLDRVELVMAFEEEFSIEIPDEKADKLTCCADVANYIVSHAQQKTADS